MYGGEKVFAAGADIKEMAEASYAEMAAAPAGCRRPCAWSRASPSRWWPRSPGTPSAAGSSSRCAADFRVAGEGARLGQPEILLGIIPGRGRDAAAAPAGRPGQGQGHRVHRPDASSAAEAHAIGLVDQVVPDESVYEAALDLVKRYAAGPALALRAAKQAIDHGLDVDLATGLEIERVQFAALFATEDQRAGMRSFLENGPGKATFTGR